ncbi:DUF3618 domain-containing protein [Terracoccus luteus]|jgi:hypothetical protein|uniref:Uncharacterized protein DUF3618 n=1 Tax=Terracoccus luteus TaxID=53356 RepID=A0A495XWY9_9MICO|nr:DUF3618 domain-containing protein [Terracoccus luteus]MBB2986953.1 hypothetical protein [Terracoccus luteus]MCP2172604.1 hypothetical protein [Terracoccus luteus]RKT77003.1 uncharacterized protein DUF3618 [Terracoccus luteus]
MSDTAAIEAQIKAARGRLEGTVNELAYRAQPQVIAERQMQSLKLRFDRATRTPDGELRVERVAAVAAAVVAVVALSVVLRRRR